MTQNQESKITVFAFRDKAPSIDPKIPQRCYKAEISPGVFKGERQVVSDEHEARWWPTLEGIMEAPVHKTHGAKIVECVIIRLDRFRELEASERALEELEARVHDLELEKIELESFVEHGDGGSPCGHPYTETCYICSGGDE